MPLSSAAGVGGGELAHLLQSQLLGSGGGENGGNMDTSELKHVFYITRVKKKIVLKGQDIQVCKYWENVSREVTKTKSLKSYTYTNLTLFTTN